MQYKKLEQVFPLQFPKIDIYHCWDAKYMTEMCATGVILCDIREVSKIISILTGAVNIANFVLANWLLSYQS